MNFWPLSKPPKGFTPCLVRRDLETFLEINGSIQHGLKERRSELVIAFFSGSHWLGRESHWVFYSEIPPENSSEWQNASLFAPPELKPVLTILPQPITLRSLIIPAGLHFGMYNDRSWRIFQRNSGSRITHNDELISTRCWLDIGSKRIPSSWLQLPLIFDERIRSDQERV